MCDEHNDPRFLLGHDANYQADIDFVKYMLTNPDLPRHPSECELALAAAFLAIKNSSDTMGYSDEKIHELLSEESDNVSLMFTPVEFHNLQHILFAAGFAIGIQAQADAQEYDDFKPEEWPVDFIETLISDAHKQNLLTCERHRDIHITQMNKWENRHDPDPEMFGLLALMDLFADTLGFAEEMESMESADVFASIIGDPPNLDSEPDVDPDAWDSFMTLWDESESDES